MGFFSCPSLTGLWLSIPSQTGIDRLDLESRHVVGLPLGGHQTSHGCVSPFLVRRGPVTGRVVVVVYMCVSVCACGLEIMPCISIDG